MQHRSLLIPFWFLGNKELSHLSEKSFDFIACSLFYMQIIVENFKSPEVASFSKSLSKFLDESFNVSFAITIYLITVLYTYIDILMHEF